MATLAELRAEAKRQKRKGYSKLKKADLEKLLDTPPPKPPRGVPRKKPEAKKAPVKKAPAKKAPAKKAPVKKAPAKKAPPKEIRVYSRSTFDDDAFYVGEDEDAVYTKYKGKIFKIGRPWDYGDVIFDDAATYLPNTVLINESTGKKISKNETDADVRESVKDAYKSIFKKIK